MGDVLLARILKYFNGTLILNDYYRFSLFFIENYNNFCDFTFDEVVVQSGVSKEKILEFLALLGFDNYDDFHMRLYADLILRTDQIRARMVGLDTAEYVNMLEVENKDAFMFDLKNICEDIYKAKRVIIVGALYPMSIAVELQTDLITFGKTVIQFHSYDDNLRFEEGDYVMFISATGRALESFLYEKKNLTLNQCQSLLITQNKVYCDKGITNEVLRVLGRFDGIKFNYQIMIIFDLIRISYYQTYHFI